MVLWFYISRSAIMTLYKQYIYTKILKSKAYSVFASQVAQWLKKKKKNLPSNTGDIRDTVSIPGSGRSPGGGNTTHSSILA